MNKGDNLYQGIRAPSSNDGISQTLDASSNYEAVSPTGSGYEEMVPSFNDKREQYAVADDTARYVGLKTSNDFGNPNPDLSGPKKNIETETNVSYSTASGYTQANVAYNSRPVQNGQDPPPQYEDIVGRNHESGQYSAPGPLYEEIPSGSGPVHVQQFQMEAQTQRVNTRSPLRQGTGLCEFWQGRCEVGVRIVILLVRM